jgi:hypothetical protein
LSNDKERIKGEIIKTVQELLSLEECKLSDIVDLSNIMLQKIDDIKVEKDSLILSKDGVNITRKVKTSVGELKLLIDAFKASNEKLLVSEIKNIAVVDKKLQNELKNYVDDLVFSLYFDVKLPKIGFKNAKDIKGVCSKNRFYKLVNDI